jgi:hypothetical protein
VDSRPIFDGLAAEDCIDEGAFQLDTLFDEVGRCGSARFRLLCQLAFSVLLEADKAFLSKP